jgi:hypothetical protein
VRATEESLSLNDPFWGSTLMMGDQASMSIIAGGTIALIAVEQASAIILAMRATPQVQGLCC